MALHGSKLACGCAVLSVQQMQVFVDSAPESRPRDRSAGGSTGSAPTKDASATGKRVTRIYWTFSDEERPLADNSRFYVDLNVHVETENHSPGESVQIAVQITEDGALSADQLQLAVALDNSGRGKIKNVFAGKPVELFAAQ